MESKNSESNSIKGLIIGKSFEFGTQLLTSGLNGILSYLSKKDDRELEKLKIEKECMIQKKKEMETLKANLKNELESREKSFLNNRIKTFSYEEEIGKDIVNNEVIEKSKNDLSFIMEYIKNDNNFRKIINEKVLYYLKYLKNRLQKSNSLNIYIMGCTGVGKSCLKNSICNKFEADEEMGKRGTVERKVYKCPCHNYISITDNIGIELGGQFNIDNIKKETKEYILNLVKSNDKAIHCIWYCITGNRLQDSEFELIWELREIYNNNNIPIIIVYTQADDDEKIKSMKKYLNSKIKNKNPNEQLGEDPRSIQFIPLLAKEKILSLELPILRKIPIPPYNVSKLIKASYDSYEYSRNLANKKCLFELIMSEIENEYKTNKINCLGTIENINDINEKEFIEIFTSVINRLFSSNFENDLFSILNNTKDLILSIISNQYKLFKSKKEQKILYEFRKIESDFCNNNSNEEINLGGFIKAEEDLKSIIDQKFDEQNLIQFKKYYLTQITKCLFKDLIDYAYNDIIIIIEEKIGTDPIIQEEIDVSSKLDTINIYEGISKLIKEIKLREEKL